MSRNNKHYKDRRDEILGYVEAGMSNPQIGVQIGTKASTVSWLLVHLGIQRTPEQRSMAQRQRRLRESYVGVRERKEREAAARADAKSRRLFTCKKCHAGKIRQEYRWYAMSNGGVKRNPRCLACMVYKTAGTEAA